MKVFYLALAIFFSLGVAARAQTTEDEKIQAFLEHLCEVNKENKFGSCCLENDNGTSMTTSSFPNCFGSLSLYNGHIDYLGLDSEGLTTLPSGVFVNFTDVRSLYLRSNSLTRLVSGTFEGLTRLNALHVTFNPISEIESGAFMGLESLSSLDFYSRNLTKLTTGTFEGLINIGRMSFSGSSISEIESGAFRGLNKLYSLELDNMQLTKLVTGTFEGLPSLSSLSFQNNPLTEIESGAFKGLSAVTYLPISSIQITKLVNGTFEGLSGMSSLYLTKLPITEIESGAFRGLTRLYSLDLKSCSLTKIVTGAFEGLDSLRSLGINSNSLLYLEENIFGSSTTMPSLFYLYSNNLLSLPDSFSSETTALPTKLYVSYNCLDCNSYVHRDILYGCSGVQLNSYCPTETNLCKDRNKFQNTHCFKCNSSDEDAFCDICLPGYKHTQNGCGCVKCEEGDKCEFGTVREPNSFCAGCSSTSPYPCSSCVMDYKMDGDNCVACDSNECCPGGKDKIISNCSSCNENKTGCYSCAVGTKYEPFEDKPYGDCKKCGDNECCVGKNYEQGCAECLDDMSGCKTCHMGSYPEKGECLIKHENECWPEGWDPSKKIEHCISCKDEEKGCALCDKEYRNQDGICVEKGKYVDGGVMEFNGVMMMIIGCIVACLSMIGWM